MSEPNLRPNDPDQLRDAVSRSYGRVVKQATDRTAARAGEAARRIGYATEELEAVPEGANLGVGCGNPTAIDALRSGETVVDLGSGAGIDSFLAARAVGPTGKVIGIDMTDPDDRRGDEEAGNRFRTGAGIRPVRDQPAYLREKVTLRTAPRTMLRPSVPPARVRYGPAFMSAR